MKRYYIPQGEYGLFLGTALISRCFQVRFQSAIFLTSNILDRPLDLGCPFWQPLIVAGRLSQVAVVKEKTLQDTSFYFGLKNKIRSCSDVLPKPIIFLLMSFHIGKADKVFLFDALLCKKLYKLLRPVAKKQDHCPSFIMKSSDFVCQFLGRVTLYHMWLALCIYEKKSQVQFLCSIHTSLQHSCITDTSIIFYHSST